MLTKLRHNKLSKVYARSTVTIYSKKNIKNIYTLKLSQFSPLSHYRYIEMVESYNCLRLDNGYIFQVEVYEEEKNKKFFKIDGDKIP